MKRNTPMWVVLKDDGRQELRLKVGLVNIMESHLYALNKMYTKAKIQRVLGLFD